MKNHELLCIASLLMGVSISPVINATTYSGNGNTGFGGAIGASSLDITDDGTSLFFDLTRGSGNLNDVFVLYLDSTTGGLSNNTTITDISDSGRQAISGCSGGGCVDIDFGVHADYAIAFDVISGANLFSINTDGSLGPLASLGGSGTNPDPTTDLVYSFDLLLSDIGLPAFSGQSIGFVGTYINPAAPFLSNEGYGVGLPSSNPGSASVTFTGFEQYDTSVVPVPAAVWLFGSGLIGLIGIARRKKV